MPLSATYMFSLAEMTGTPHKITFHHWPVVQLCDQSEIAH